MTIPQAIALFIAALLAGALNSVAGGGSFISFPTLLLTGVPSIPANATNTVALWPGSVASIGPYRNKLNTRSASFAIFTGVSVAGGILGAIVLLHTDTSTFNKLIPFLLLMATLVFTFGGRLTAWLRARFASATVVEGDAVVVSSSPVARIGVPMLQFIIAFYGGFFGGGIGILMLALLAVLGMEDIHAMNALKVVLASVINGVAVVAFIIARAVLWPQAIVMIIAAIIGGYGGAYVARRLDPHIVRGFVIVVGFAMTIIFFIRYIIL